MDDQNYVVAENRRYQSMLDNPHLFNESRATPEDHSPTATAHIQRHSRYSQPPMPFRLLKQSQGIHKLPNQVQSRLKFI